jgi:hypothetical protein
VVNICTTQYPLDLKNSLIVNTTNNLAKLNKMLYNLFKTELLMKETCKPDVQWRRESQIIMMQ